MWSGRCTVHRELPAFVGSHCAIARCQEAGSAPSTNVVVALLRNKPTKVRERYRQAEASGDYLALSSVVLFELWYGVARSSQVPENTERLRILLSGDLDLLDFDDEDARTAGQVRAALEKDGNPIGAYDLLIAGQALRRGLTVVTANTSEFGRVTGLSWLDWTT